MSLKYLTNARGAGATSTSFSESMKAKQAERALTESVEDAAIVESGSKAAEDLFKMLDSIDLDDARDAVNYALAKKRKSDVDAADVWDAVASTLREFS